MTVLLDIDGVLIGWSGKPDEKSSGFSDWARPEPAEMFFNFTSQEQLALIAEQVGNHVQWHTTWIQKGYRVDAGRMVDYFTEQTGFGPFPIAVEEFFERPWPSVPCFKMDPRGDGTKPRAEFPDEVANVLLRTDWWKLNAVAALLVEGKLDGRVVWVDDELNSNWWAVKNVLTHFGAFSRFMIVSPREVWERDSILEAAEFLNGA